MKIFARKTIELSIALALSALLLLSAYMLADYVKTSDLVVQSRLVGIILKDTHIDIKSLVIDQNQRGLVQKFLHSVANAYVDFEFIPYREAETFKVVLAAINPGVSVDSFKYSGKDLSIDTIGSFGDINQFVKALQQSEYFGSIELLDNSLEVKNNYIINCYAKETAPIMPIF